MIDKVDNPQALAVKLRQVPVSNNNSDWNCVYWLQNALELVAKSKPLIGTSTLSWGILKTTATQYCEKKVA